MAYAPSTTPSWLAPEPFARIIRGENRLMNVRCRSLGFLICVAERKSSARYLMQYAALLNLCVPRLGPSLVLCRLNVRYWPPESSSEYLHGGTDTKQSRGGEAIAPSPRAVVLADNQNRLPRVMRLRGAVIFANLASPEAWRLEDFTLLKYVTLRIMLV